MAKRIVVELNRQGLTAFDGTTKVHEFDCATGDSDHPTPMGIFKISRRHRLYVSKTYNVRMDCAMFFHKGVRHTSGVRRRTDVVSTLTRHRVLRVARVRPTFQRERAHTFRMDPNAHRRRS